MMKLVVAGAMALPTPLPAQTAAGGAPAVFAGPPTHILVLGTPHLSSLSDSFAPEHLQPLLDRLAAWKPDLVTIEALSGQQCDQVVRYRALYDGVDRYCADTAAAKHATGLDIPEATIEAERLLAVWPGQPSPAERRRLAAVFLAAGERASALVQWLRLTPAERHAGDGVDAALASQLEGLRTRQNENYLIASALAARLGLDRVHATDDHTADGAVAGGPAYEAALRRIWNSPVVKARAEVEARHQKGGSAARTLAYYRYLNAPGQARIVFDSDFGAALKDRSPGLEGRRYVAWWETRNLRMVANIRAVTADRPGARVLTVVGASHKAYFEDYLRRLHDVRIADVGAVLR